MRNALWREVEPRSYAYRITPDALVQSFLIAFLARLSGLRAVVERCGRLLGTANFSSLCHALRRPSSLAFVKAMLGALETRHEPGRDELVALDSMALALPKTQRHNLKKYNNKTVGGGVLWAYMIESAKGTCPVKILRVLQGAWHDSKVMRGVALAPKGPVYLMDRGFYALELLEKWLGEKVRFIVRVRKNRLVFETLRILSAPGPAGDLRVSLDAIVRLGGARAKAHPVVRLIRAVLPSGEELIVASNKFGWSTRRVLDAYRKRWHIERFHRFLKDALGLSHLYSFSRRGIAFLLYTALLLAMLLVQSAEVCAGETIRILRGALRDARRRFGLGTTWKRNICAGKRAKKRRKNR